MTPQVRAKFRVTAIKKHHTNPGAEITLSAQYDSAIPEDQRFMRATPWDELTWGELTFQVNNPPAVAAFEMGKAFYLDFTPVAEDQHGNTVHGT